jgi:hypothetical protein
MAAGLGQQNAQDAQQLGSLLLALCAYADETGVDAECALRTAVSSHIAEIEKTQA